MRTVTLCGTKAAGRVALVDDEDFELVSRHRWYVHETIRDGRVTKGPYAFRQAGTKRTRRTNLFMHTLITGYALVDHRDHDGLNNQCENLRDATVVQNHANRLKQPGSSSLYKGVSWHAHTGKWRSYISIDNRHRHLGLFITEAAVAYDAAALNLHGEFALLNFPHGGVAA
jgi:hypothetical protein